MGVQLNRKALDFELTKGQERHYAFTPRVPVSTIPRDIDMLSIMPPDELVRRFPLRGPGLMWLLGAGASAAAGIPTAYDMIWEFKQKLFVSQRRTSLQAVSDLSSEAIRRQLQAHVDASEDLPRRGAPDEYAALFERVYPAEEDRRSFIEATLKGARPSYGHMALATLMKGGLTRVVWTTNFDALVADACARVYGNTAALATVALDAPDLAAQLLTEERWPLEIKLHGDFRSRRLKNTSHELRNQDARLRSVFVDCCRRFGLIVVGYSGRDDSVMDALIEAASQNGSFPAGIYWLHKGDAPPAPRVDELITTALHAGANAHLISIDSFDEILRDVVRLTDVDTTTLDAFASERRRWSPAPRPTGPAGFPVLRFNALPVLERPTVTRRVVCSIGGSAEVRQAVATAGVQVFAARKRGAVIAFGRDDDIRRAFGEFGITEFDLHSIDERRLRFDSTERGLLRDSLAHGVATARRMGRLRRRSADLLWPNDPSDRGWNGLRQLVGPVEGTVPSAVGLRWVEGIGLRVEWAEERMWLLFEPRTVFIGINESNKTAAADFGRERNVRRYNPLLNALIEYWAQVLAGDNEPIRTLGIGDGVDATFRLGSITAFSKRLQA